MRAAIILLLLLVPVVFAQDAVLGNPVSVQWADWEPANVAWMWDYVEDGFCATDSECLVNPAGNKSRGIDDWFGSVDDTQGPRCISSGEYILDNLCDDGQWTSRTRQLAGYLLATGIKPLSLTCGSYSDVLIPNVSESLVLESYIGGKLNTARDASKVNNVCVMKSSDGVMMGMTLNVPVAQVLPAFGVPSNFCNPSFVGFQPCGTSDGLIFRYDSGMNALIVSDIGRIGTLFSEAISDYVISLYNKIVDYVMGTLHQEGFQDYSVFENVPSFSSLYVAEDFDGNQVMAFLQENQTQSRVSYLGIRFEGYDLNDSPCSVLFQWPWRARCEQQGAYRNDGFFVVAAKYANPDDMPLVEAWHDLTSKMRIK